MQKNVPSLENILKALTSLERAIQQPKNEFSRDSVIQRFEYTLELSWKIMKKFLSYSGTESTTPRDVIRDCAQAGWVRSPETWMHFLEARNLTSHIYNEDVAEKVYSTAVQLPGELREVIECLQKI